MKVSFFLLMLLVLATNLFSQEIIFGPEFTFSNNEILKSMQSPTDYNNPTYHQWLERWKEKLEEMCAGHDCKITKTSDKHGPAYKITFPDGWWFQISMDTGCLEVQSKPDTHSSFLARKSLVDELIFESASNLGLKPHKRIGGGHVNMDLETAFGDDHRLFRNFIVDRYNHPELGWGIFGNSMGNGPPISALNDESINAFKKAIKESDQSTKIGFENILELVGKIKSKVYTSHPLHEIGQKFWTPDYYQDLNLRFVSKYTSAPARRVELRAHRPQQDFQEFLDIIKLYEERVNFLRDYGELVPLVDEVDYHPGRNTIIERFKSFLKEMGLDPIDFKRYFNGPIALDSSGYTPKNRKVCKQGILSLIKRLAL